MPVGRRRVPFVDGGGRDHAGPSSSLIVGGVDRVRDHLAALIDATRADKVIVITHARKRSYTLVAEALVSMS
jgi:hypothetical protein